MKLCGSATKEHPEEGISVWTLMKMDGIIKKTEKIDNKRGGSTGKEQHRILEYHIKGAVKMSTKKQYKS